MKLPLNCTVNYIHNFLTNEEADILYNLLIDEYKLNKAQMVIYAGDRLITTDSFKILFTSEKLFNQNSHPKEIHGKSFVWSGLMNKLKKKVEFLLNKQFELAMCLYYPNGNYFAPYHSDQETSDIHTILPSISLGEVREFSFKNNLTNELYNLELAHGSLLVMGSHCQSRYEHSLTKNSRYKKGRINITFRESNFK